MQAFVVVLALLAVAALGWILSRTARRMLRRCGVPTDERPVADAQARASGRRPLAASDERQASKDAGRHD